MNKMNALCNKAGQALTGLGLCAVSTLAAAVNDLPVAATKIAEDQRWLHYSLLVFCMVTFVGVFGFMFWSVLMHRKAKGAKAANFHESTTVEIIWTIVPFIIVIGMAFPATKVVVAMKDTSSADLTIKAQQEGAVAGQVREAGGVPVQRDVSTGR
jgi:cytochrome c oxidase subunit 2